MAQLIAADMRTSRASANGSPFFCKPATLRVLAAAIADDKAGIQFLD
jgi:hypothetical protein